jgi:hypothetical protein
MKRILIGLFALLMLFASPTELLAQRKKAPTKPATTVKASTVVEQSQSENESKTSSTQDGERSVSLKETTDWILKRMQHLKGKSGMNLMMYNGPFYQGDFQFNGCNISYTIGKKEETEEEFRQNRTYKEAWEVKESFSFSDIDPLTIEVFDGSKAVQTWYKIFGENDQWGISMETSGGEYKIKGKKEGSEQWRSITKFFIGEKEMAGRTARAFKHVVKLCGGKVDPF